MSRGQPSRPPAPPQSGSEERTAFERPADQVSAGRSPLHRSDPNELVTGRLQEHGSTRHGRAWTCPRCRKRTLYVTPARDHPNAVVVHCQKCDAGRRPRQESLVLDKIGLTLRDLFPQEPSRQKHRNRDVNQRSSNVVVNSVPISPRPSVDRLLAEYEAGLRKPALVKLGPMPERATPDMRRIAEDMRLLLALFESAGETRPMPYACTWAAERMGWGRKAFRRANDAIRALVRAEVIRATAPCSPRGRKSGTKCYLPALPAELRESVDLAPAIGDGGLDDAPDSVREGGSVPIEAEDVERRVAVKPPAETPDQALVGDAVAGSEASGVAFVLDGTVAAMSAARGSLNHGSAAHLTVEAATPTVEGLGRPLAMDPAVPSDDQRFVHGTKARAVADVGVAASRDGAVEAFRSGGHADDDNALIGAQTALDVDRAPTPDESDPPWLDDFLRRCGGDA